MSETLECPFCGTKFPPPTPDLDAVVGRVRRRTEGLTELFTQWPDASGPIAELREAITAMNADALALLAAVSRPAEARGEADSVESLAKDIYLAIERFAALGNLAFRTDWNDVARAIATKHTHPAPSGGEGAFTLADADWCERIATAFERNDAMDWDEVERVFQSLAQRIRESLAAPRAGGAEALDYRSRGVAGASRIRRHPAERGADHSTDPAGADAVKRTPLARKSPIKRGGRVNPINPKRRTSEFARCYGSKARVAWVKAQPCAVVNCNMAPCENAHIETGGMGRKADADKIIPLCRDHHWQAHNFGWDVLSGLQTEGLREHMAAQTQARWERYAQED